MRRCDEIKRLMEKEYETALANVISRVGRRKGETGSVESYELASAISNELEKRLPVIERKILKKVQKEIEPGLRGVIESGAYLNLVEGDDPHTVLNFLNQIYDAIKNYLDVDFKNQMRRVILELEDVVENSERSLKDLFLAQELGGGKVVDAIYNFLENQSKISEEFAEKRYDLLKDISSMTGEIQFLKPEMPQFYHDSENICRKIEEVRDGVLYIPEEGKYTYASYTAEDVRRLHALPLFWLLEKSVERNHGELREEKKGKFVTDPKIVRSHGSEVFHTFNFKDPVMVYAVVVKTSYPELHSYPRTIRNEIVGTLMVRDSILAEKISDDVYRGLKEQGIEDEEMVHYVHRFPEKIVGEEKRDEVLERAGVVDLVIRRLYADGIDINSSRKKKGRAKGMEILGAAEYYVLASHLNMPYLDAAEIAFGDKSKFILYVVENTKYRRRGEGELVEC